MSLSTDAEIIIIGGGLTGLTLAYKLKQQDHSCTILESRSRLGGRIHTIHSTKHTPVDMGATWFGMKHKNLVRLLDELELTYFKQFMEGTSLFEPISFTPPQKFNVPPNEEPSYRIAGGTTALINTLASSLEENQIKLNQKVQSISYANNEIIVRTQGNQFKADKVITTLPPLLLLKSIEFTPELPDTLVKIGQNTDIWMADSIKCGLTYETPFWREADYSGTAFSNVGPFTELYDHSNYKNNKFALKGFLKSDMYSQNKHSRKKQVVAQLVTFFGAPAKKYLSYEEKIWREEPETYIESPNFIPPHANNGHKVYDETFYDDRLFISGSETSANFGGYMEGAVSSAYATLNNLLKS